MKVQRRRARRMHPCAYVNSDGTVRLDIDHDTNQYLHPRRCGWCASEDIHRPVPSDNEPWKEICGRCGAWHFWDHGNVNDGWHREEPGRVCVTLADLGLDAQPWKLNAACRESGPPRTA